MKKKFRRKSIRTLKSFFIKKFGFFILILCIIFLAVDGYADDLNKNYVRIAICKNEKSINLKIDGTYKITALYTDDLLAKGSYLPDTKVIPTISGINIGKEKFKIFAVHIDVGKYGEIYVNNRRFRGDLDIIRNKQKQLLVVNYIDIDQYLYGVLFNEISPDWDIEAIKAQVIAARTFALYQTTVNFKKEYDMTADVYSQIYGGKTSENQRLNKIIDETKNIILTFRAEIFPTYYHATCAGKTEDASKVWGMDIKPLKGSNCRFCKESPYFKWKKIISLSQIRDKLNKNGYYLRDIKSIQPLYRDESGRYTKVNIDGLVLDAYKFRLILGPDKIKSTNFNVILDSKNARFAGYGWGHGVGLCQWGAKNMAEKGYSAEKILDYYYPGAKLVRIK